ncbi:hypothetical protein TCAP_04383 [Tolypocladium capitatum]|uniref:Uncharacterized protein n=1 Tax=Tolypocladium capitatum TaxID=45235 RepID=A0A2K3QDQ9_9HYPO|nr:hypothetical protein TCAP_04383 [Tolypocladium capitatum]
MNAAIFGS